AQARNILLRRFRDVDAARLNEELDQMYTLVARVSDSESDCPACAIADAVAFKPIFSTPVNAPFKVDLALTYACNNACPHCYNEPDRFTMPALDTATWFEVLKRVAAIGIPHVILTGGEPTLRPDLPEIVKHADALGLIVGMNTNGRRLSDPALAAALAEAGLNHVQITLESNREAVHDAMVGAPNARGRPFQETVAGIKNAVAGGIHTLTNTTLTRRNQDHAVDIVDFVYSLGLDTFAMNGMIYAGGGVMDPDAIPAEEMAALLAAVRDRAEELDLRFLWYTVTDYCRFSPLALGLAPKRCNAAEYSMCIEPDGDVLPCQSYYRSAGNILADDWDSIWNSALFRSFRDRETDPQAAGLPRACWDCPDLEMCGGGCRLEHEMRTSERPAERGCGRGRAHTGTATFTLKEPDPT
ncbi:MAG: radical SAM protein, partial [Anaerolineae bacterium]|nr:radical SAM protein [Anaerolineae bacterium]